VDGPGRSQQVGRIPGLARNDPGEPTKSAAPSSSSGCLIQLSSDSRGGSDGLRTNRSGGTVCAALPVIGVAKSFELAHPVDLRQEHCGAGRPHVRRWRCREEASPLTRYARCSGSGGTRTCPPCWRCQVPFVLRPRGWTPARDCLPDASGGASIELGPHEGTRNVEGFLGSSDTGRLV
jgi:hypothetical protein